MLPPKAQRRETGSSFRPEIQGLRALAVGAVILNHLTGWPGGGFVGVDIFFVISGFLITGLLLREHRRTGRISLGDFYRRRIRRIIPATVLVLAVTVVASFYLLNAARGRQTVVDGFWSLFFSANWRFASTGTDYFQASRPRSPLEHFWSLGVEEQFYLAWPWLIVAVFALVSGVANPRRFGRIVLGAAMIVIVIGSFAYACFDSVTNPTWAYFSTFTRAWELGVGALLALLAASLASIPASWRPALAWLGLATIVASFWLIDEHTLFPGPWSALPVLSAALVIAAGTGAPPRYLLPLTNPVSVWVGEISYSLYLWHFPVIILMASVLPESSAAYFAVSSILILGLAVAAFYGLENPVRKSSWLAGRSPAVKPRSTLPVGRLSAPRLIGVGCLGVACVLFASLALSRVPSSNAAGGPVSRSTGEPTNDSTAAKAERDRAIVGALSATTWPTLQPSLGDLENAVLRSPCALTYGSPPIAEVAEIKQTCVQGDMAAKHTVLVIGDSLANSYLPAVVAAVEPMGWNVIGLTRSGCPAIKIDMLLVNTRLPYRECDDHQALLPKRAEELDPDLIVVSSGASPARNLLASKATGAAGLREWRRAAEASLDEYAKTAPVVVLQGPPRGKDLHACATRLSDPADCASPPQPGFADFRKAEKKAVQALDGSDVRYVTTQDWFCSQELRCPAFLGSTPTFVDGAHLSVDAARALGPLLVKPLRRSMTD